MRHTQRTPQPQRGRTPSSGSGSGSGGRGIGTLIGNGWLREQPRDPGAAPPSPSKTPGAPWAGIGRWDARSKSALRKCMFMPIPDEIRRLMLPPVSAAAVPVAARPAQPPVLRAQDVAPHRNNPRHNVGAFPAYIPPQALGANPPMAQYNAVDPRIFAAQAHAYHVQNAQRAAMKAHQGGQGQGQGGQGGQAWWEDPVALGSLLILLPPVGLAAVWSSKRYSTDARWALTVMTGLTMCLMSAIVIAALSMR
jgi:hypothetical protein